MVPKRLNTSASEASINSNLSERRRERLLNIKKREELKDALTEKFKGRFGHGAAERSSDEVSVASAAIRSEVNKFTSSANCTVNNISRLERRIQQKAKPDADVASEISAYSAAPSFASRRSRSVAGLSGANIVGAGQKGYDWSKLDEYASYLHEQDCIRQAMGVKALQKKLKNDLDQQVAMKQHRRDIEKEEDARYHKNSMIELERWKAVEQLRDDEKHTKIMREKEDRDLQLEYERKLKAEETQKKKDEEAVLVTKIVEEMEQEQKKFAKKKETTIKAMRKVFAANAIDQAKKQMEQKEQAEKEAAALKEYARVMEEQEEQRKQELDARLAKQKELMAKLQANTDNAKKGASNNDATRALAQQEEMDRHFNEAEVCKQNRLKQLRLENQAYLLKQMEEKEMRKDDDKMLQDIQAQILTRDTDEYNEIEKKKVTDKRSRLVEYQKDIKQQMAHKLAQSVPVMTDVEIQMNKPLLQLVNRTLDARDSQVCTIPEAVEEE